jgi:hypothetical protein
MKIILLGMLVLTSFSGHSMTDGLTIGTLAESSNENPDGTTTVFKPSLVRGNKSYPFGYKANKDGVCKAMGFEKYLNQSAFKFRDGNTQRAYVTANGQYETLKDSEYHSIQEITCFNGVYKTQTTLKGYIENRDNTVTIAEPKLVIGNRSYPFGYKANKDGVCKAMGFEKYLNQSAFKFRDGNTQRAYVTANGQYETLKDSEYHSIQEITCFNAENVTVVVDQQGNYYFSRNN